ncbi:endolytic transglycosylase MltG [Ancylomarina euxinus]|uniref:Endolytic murein transglycosylase n=1 Tax=Ancylomarina euxinus TaxID=2283627 RepID=A0A425XZH1_9BACT|nr:endolytic transglycosylase MltG [Ancylomarina euxinus]MCZ4694811.1 endolytic transglycosylase MltG [Ancylomarina euxinus]MUP15885.1 endolytic transglycosylase MltG [Ancylomarina euxinus]RRG20522.1 endolytic transglycosylase MltG [Ancylomarina euxinus]
MINLFRLEKLQSKKLKYGLIAIFILFVVVGTVLLKYYRNIFSSNIDLGEKTELFIQIPSGADMQSVLHLFEESHCVINLSSLEWVMNKKHYGELVKSGQYRIEEGMSNNNLVNILRSGDQAPINLTFNNTRTLEEFAGKIGSQIESDSLSILNFLKDEASLKPYGFKPETVIGLFIPNSYQVYWNMSPKSFTDRMYKEYVKFWNVDRMKKASKLNLTPMQVSTLASIVDEETIKEDEKARVAGVYINRLKRGIKLDADPTLKFAWGDFSMRRVLNKHKAIKSPYNTYKYAGLPPGPIRQASVSGLNSVLNCETHKYIYFCASPEFNGYHVFASSLREHNKNAANYQRALNLQRIFK